MKPLVHKPNIGLDEIDLNWKPGLVWKVWFTLVVLAEFLPLLFKYAGKQS